MLTLRALALALFLASSFAGNTDAGCGIDPNGCSGGFRTQGGGAMDPNGIASADTDYSACVDPNGRCRG